MPTIEVSVRRVSVVSSRPFDEIVRRLTATIGHPSSERQITMTRFEREVHTATVHTMRGWDGASRIAWRSLLATVGGAVGLVLLAAPCYAQAAATGGAETSASGLPSAELGGATEHGKADGLRSARSA